MKHSVNVIDSLKTTQSIWLELTIQFHLKMKLCAALFEFFNLKLRRQANNEGNGPSSPFNTLIKDCDINRLLPFSPWCCGSTMCSWFLNFPRETSFFNGRAAQQNVIRSTDKPNKRELTSSSDLCLAINVTITPSPFTVVQEGQNITLSCVVSQRRRNTTLPVVKWTFLPAGAHGPGGELLIARVNMRKARFYGNYTKSFPWPKIKLTVVKQGKIFDLLIMKVSEKDQGLYMCRVQEFKKHQERWKASTNYTAATELRGEGAIYCFVQIRPLRHTKGQVKTPIIQS